MTAKMQRLAWVVIALVATVHGEEEQCLSLLQGRVGLQQGHLDRFSAPPKDALPTPTCAAYPDQIHDTALGYLDTKKIGDIVIVRISGSAIGALPPTFVGKGITNIFGGQNLTYSMDSSFAKAVVHAGILADGDVGPVYLTIVPIQTSFPSTTANGVTTAFRPKKIWCTWLQPRIALRMHTAGEMPRNCHSVCKGHDWLRRTNCRDSLLDGNHWSKRRCIGIRSF